MPRGGSGDFAFVSREVPAAGMLLAAGGANDGYLHGLQHPKVRSDDSVLHVGAAAHACAAPRPLEQTENK